MSCVEWKFSSHAFLSSFFKLILFISHRRRFLSEKLSEMTSLLQLPDMKVRNRASSIPTLMSLEEENTFSATRLTVNNRDGRKYSDSALPTAVEKPQKTSRRSSLSLGLLSGKSDSSKSGKRRSSIAVVFLGRKNSKVCNSRP